MVLENLLPQNLFSISPLWDPGVVPECLFLRALPRSHEHVLEIQLAKQGRMVGASAVSACEFTFSLQTLPNGELSVCESVKTCCKSLLKLKLFNSLILQGILILRLDFQSQEIV